MANDTDNLFESLVAASSEAATHLTYQNSFVEGSYWEYKPISAKMGQTLQVTIPTVNEGDVADIQGGPLQPTDTRNTAVDIVLNHKYSTSWVVQDYDELRSPVTLREKHIQPRMEAILRSVNHTIASLINTTNFSTHTLISGAGADVFQRADLAGAWRNLANVGAPVSDTRNLILNMNLTAYSGMIADTSFVAESTVGVTMAEAAQQRAVIDRQYGAKLMWDQHWSVYNSGKQPAIFYHRHAIACVTAPLPRAGQGHVIETYTKLRGQVPVKTTIGWSQEKQGWLIDIGCAWGCVVARPEYGSLLETA